MMYSGRCLIAFLSRSKSVISDTSPVTPKPILTTDDSQFSWGSWISDVSSIDTILALGLMNIASVLMVVVLPEAVPPTTTAEACFSMTYQNHAAISADIVLYMMRSVAVSGLSLNFRIVNVEPRRVTSFSYVIWTRLPSGSVASRTGCAMLIALPVM